MRSPARRSAATKSSQKPLDFLSLNPRARSILGMLYVLSLPATEHTVLN